MQNENNTIDQMVLKINLLQKELLDSTNESNAFFDESTIDFAIRLTKKMREIMAQKTNIKSIKETYEVFLSQTINLIDTEKQENYKNQIHTLFEEYKKSYEDLSAKKSEIMDFLS